MPNVLDANGLTMMTRDEVLEYFTTQFRKIYGEDINIESNTPDGQWLNICTQAVVDMQDLVTQVYTSFDPDQAVGVILDQRVTINGIQRQQATYTYTNITIVISESVNLYGLDGATVSPDVRDDGEEIYTVQDNEGNLWFLTSTEIGVPPGEHVFTFRAAVPGEQLTTPNTITVPVTIVLGVDSVNNPEPYLILGENEEKDAALRIRRQRSVSLASQGYLRGLLAALENVSGVTSAFVYENTTSVTDVDGVPGHSIWVIIAGNADAQDIAQAIYTKRNAGCGMKGDTSYTIEQIDGSPFTVRWDIVQVRNIFIKFNVSSINGVTPPPVGLIRTGLAASYVPGVNQSVNINEIATRVQDIDANTLVTGAGISLGTLQILTFSGVAASGSFKVSYNGNDSAAINWNDNIATIEGKIQAITGLTAATVTGSISGQELVFNLSNLSNVLALLVVKDNSLQTSAPADVSVSFDANFANTLAAPTKRNQLVVTSPNIIIVPMSLLPANSSVLAEGLVQFNGFGGYGAYIFSLQVDNSGATIDPVTGLYTAGSTPGVTDTIKVTDQHGNTAIANVVVTT
jgi:hypothetical protein